MRFAGLFFAAWAVCPLTLLAQGWTFTPSAYPDVCTNPATIGQWTMDYATATNRAALENKKLYLYLVGSTWCPDCNGLETQVTSKPAFETFMANSDAYWVWLDFPNRKATNATQYAWLCHPDAGLFSLEEAEAILARNRLIESTYAVYKKYRTSTTINMPTLLVLKPDGSYQGEVTHYRQLTNVTAEAFIAKINRIWNDDAWDVQDNRVPGKSDDTAATATPLTNIVEAVTRQSGHTLSETDAADWYVFTAQPGLTYTFAAESQSPEAKDASSLTLDKKTVHYDTVYPKIFVEVYTETNAAAVPVASAFGEVGGTTAVEWTLNQALPKACYVKVSGSSSRYDFAYSLARKNVPVGVRFEAAAVSAAETAASATLNVVLDAPSAAEGGVRVFFSTRKPASPVPFGTATPGQDYVAVVSNEVAWTRDEALQQVVKQVTVPLIQDLRPAWEGNEQVAVFLSDGLNSAVTPEGGAATVTLLESAKRVSGTVGFAAQGEGAAPFPNGGKPALTVREGVEAVLWLGRAGGSDGEVSATVETVGGTAQAGVAFTPKSVNVVWPHGDASLRQVSVATLVSDAFEADRTFAVRVTQTTASGITAGAGNVTVTVRDQLVAQGLNGDAGAALKYSSSGAATWFFGAAGELRCSPVAAGKNATLKTTVKGPGRLFFQWGFLPAVDAANRLVIKVGRETRTYVAGDDAAGTETFTVTKAGAQTVTWQVFADGAEAAAVAVSNLVWQPLQKTASPVPAQNFVCTGSPAWLEWGAVAAADEYRVYLGETPGKLVQVVPEGGGSITDTRVNPCLECVLTDEMKHYWRVDAVMHVPGGDDVVVKGDVWPFSIKSWDGPVTELPKFEETESLSFTASGAYRLVAGVRYELGPFSMLYDCGCGDPGEPAEDDPLMYRIIGKLPTGLSMKDLSGATHFVGVPSQTGDFALWVQSLATVEGGKVIGSTLPVAFSVVPLQQAAGVFNGWVSSDAAPKKNGSLALTVSEAGRLTAKVQAGGKVLTFSKNSFDAETNGVVYVRLETAAFTTAAGVGYTNTLDLALSMSDGRGAGTLTRVEALQNEAGQIVAATSFVSRATLFRNSLKDAEAAEVAKACAGYYTVALPVVSATDNAPMGSGYLTLTIAESGAVRLAGVLADGKSWSSSATLLAGEEVEDLGPAGVRTNLAVRVLVYAAPSAYRNAGGLCGLLRLAADEAAGGLCIVPDEALPLRWWNEATTSVYGYDPEAASSGFNAVLDASGGFYDSVMNLQTWYLGRTLSFGAFGGDSAAPYGYNGTDDTTSGYTLVDETPEGLRVNVLPQALTVDKKTLVYVEGQPVGTVNPHGLRLAYTRATGLMSGGFSLFYQSATPGATNKTKACAYKGILTPLRASGGLWTSTEGQGFYLIPDTSVYTDGKGKAVTYGFDRSYRLTLESAAP